ncbi:MAG: tRNA glutamyl-Q(34) synthetase GluQRS [Gallionellaceae bacterium]|nr:tRNA glutamyl-Q(34) synthetase GluQRS [Gallionellaceae bacterium]
MAMPAYRGRFAPTPSGPLHFGSLVAALGSYLEARSHDGAWLLRIEDVDPPRVAAGSADAILHTLEAFGFEWDGPVMYQSRRGEAYRAAVDELWHLGLVYACACSRKQLSEVARRGVDGPVYPGTCRTRQHADRALAQRFRVPDSRVIFHDNLLGHVACNVASECGDFVLRRADGIYSYQLAVVVDDAEQGVSHVVRGADLLTSTPRQIVLQQALDLPTPAYLHLPVAFDEQGAKLSKQTLAQPVESASPLAALRAAARFLGLALPADIDTSAGFWQAALAAWPGHSPPPIRGRRPNPCNP